MLSYSVSCCLEPPSETRHLYEDLKMLLMMGSPPLLSHSSEISESHNVERRSHAGRRITTTPGFRLLLFMKTSFPNFPSLIFNSCN